MRPNVKRARLEDVAKVYAGTNLKAPKTAFGEGGCPWVMVEDLENSEITKTARDLNAEAMRTARVVPPRTVLFSSSGTIGKVGITRAPMAPNNNIFAVEFDPEQVLPLYGMYCLAALRSELETEAQGAAYRSLRLSRFRKFTIPVPELAWQAMAADKLDILHRMLEQQRLAVEDAMQSALELFEARFSKAARLALEQRELTLESCAEIFLNGAAKTEKPGATAVRYVATPQLEDWVISQDRVPTIGVEPFAAERFRLRPGDIVMNRVNQADRLGRCGLVAKLPEEPAVFGQNTLCIRADRGKICPPFLLAWLTHPYIKQYIRNSAKHSTLFQSTLNRQSLSLLPVPLVSLEEQEAFAKAFTRYWGYVDHGTQILEDLRALQQTWYDRIRLLLRESAEEAPPALYEEDRYWIAPSGTFCYYDAALDCVQAPGSELPGLRLSQLPTGVDLQFLGSLRTAEDPAYGVLAHVRLRRTGRNSWSIVQMLPRAYLPQDAAATDRLERAGMLSEQQDFGYLRQEAPLRTGGWDLAAEILQRETARLEPGYSRFARLPAAARRLVGCLSPFQQAVYETFLLCQQPLSCGLVLEQLLLRAGPDGLSGHGLQDVSATVRLLENTGLLERQRGAHLQYDAPHLPEAQRSMLDHRGQPIAMDIWDWAAPRG